MSLYIPFVLSRSGALAQITITPVAVPAYASLVIETNLWEKSTNKLLFSGSHEKLASLKWTSPSDDVIRSKDYGQHIDHKIANTYVDWGRTVYANSLIQRR